MVIDIEVPKAFISGGNEQLQSTAYSSTTIYDGGSFDMTQKPNSQKLTYKWRCTFKPPVSKDPCDQTGPRLIVPEQRAGTTVWIYLDVTSPYGATGSTVLKFNIIKAEPSKMTYLVKITLGNQSISDISAQNFCL